MHGIIPLYKPKGLTSHDCVQKIRQLTRLKKVGHTGTLDPDVEGVLPICLGEATKVIPFLSDLPKTYVAELYLGKATTTEDATGEVIAEKFVDQLPSDATIAKVFKQFTGEIKQQVPLYAAVKVKGKKLYEYARQNIPVERPVRNVTIYRLERLPLSEETEPRIRFRVTCSKGTYIRTLCVDLGKALGYPAHMAYLLREESDSIPLNETVTFADIERAINAGMFDQLILPITRVLSHLSTYQVNLTLKKRVLQGQKLRKPDEPLSNPFVVQYRDQLLAIYQVDPHDARRIKPVRVFNLYRNEGEHI